MHTLNDIITGLNRLASHYKECSLELAQEKEQRAAEWDELLCEHDYQKEQCNTFDGLDAGSVWVCPKCDDQLDGPNN